MTIDAAYAINKEGVLSVTVRCITTVPFKGTYGSSLSKISVAGYDLYLLLESNENPVTVYEPEPGKNELQYRYQNNLFHIGIPEGDGYKLKDKLQKALDKVLQYYH